MKRPRLWLCVGVLVAGGMFWLNTPSARAVKSFKAGFEGKYGKADSNDPKHVAFAAAVSRAKCSVCHVGKDKKQHNVYGMQLATLLDRKADGKNAVKIQAALEVVAGMKSDPGDENSPTFGELISQGRLPAAGSGQ